MNIQQVRHSMDSKSLAFQAYQKLEEMIVMLELKPGELLSEGSICERIGIGRTPVREALKRLADDSLVSILNRRGIQITHIDIKQQLYLVELQRVLEELVFSRAARRRTAAQAAHFRRIEGRMAKSVAKNHVVSFMQASRAFTDLASTSTRNSYLQNALAPLHSVTRRFWYANYERLGTFSLATELEKGVIEAIIEGDEAAAIKAASDHMAYVDQLTRLALDLDV